MRASQAGETSTEGANDDTLCQFCTNLNFLLPIVSSYRMEHFDKRNKRLWENWMSCVCCTKVVVSMVQVSCRPLLLGSGQISHPNLRCPKYAWDLGKIQPIQRLSTKTVFSTIKNLSFRFLINYDVIIIYYIISVYGKIQGYKW